MRVSEAVGGRALFPSLARGSTARATTVTEGAGEEGVDGGAREILVGDKGPPSAHAQRYRGGSSNPIAVRAVVSDRARAGVWAFDAHDSIALPDDQSSSIGRSTYYQYVRNLIKTTCSAWTSPF